MIKLQPLGPVRGQQQQSTLAAANFPAPLGQPFDEGLHRRFRTTGFQRVLGHGFLQQFDPGIRDLTGQPRLDFSAGHQAGIPSSEPFHQSPRFPQVPHAGELLVGHLHRNIFQFAQAAHRVQMAPISRHPPRR